MTVVVKTGMRLRSAVGGAEVIVIRAEAGDVDLRCGGAPMVADGEPIPQGIEPAPGFTEPMLLGKRYSDAEDTIELLCTKAGPATLSLGETPLTVKGPRPLPASD